MGVEDRGREERRENMREEGRHMRVHGSGG